MKTYCDFSLDPGIPGQGLKTVTAELISDPGTGIVCIRVYGEFAWVSVARITNRRNHA